MSGVGGGPSLSVDNEGCEFLWQGSGAEVLEVSAEVLGPRVVVVP